MHNQFSNIKISASFLDMGQIFCKWAQFLDRSNFYIATWVLTQLLHWFLRGGWFSPPPLRSTESDPLPGRVKESYRLKLSQRKSLDVFELTVPGETRISTAHNIKLQKYQHFCTDINSYKVSVIPFEIGSHTGYLTRENKESLKILHKFCKRELKFKSFKNNISAITVLASYFIFNNRNIETWQSPSNYIYVPMIN